ncbi:MAG TPA: hypothetical protein VNN12_04530 [Dehalococcoidia bacterium]|nr:hypothetical protein [Dehalococcoidia bacterium]
MSSQDFVSAAAIAGTSIGLAFLLMVCVAAVVAVWRLHARSMEAFEEAIRASLSIQELAQRVEQMAPAPGAPAQGPAAAVDAGTLMTSLEEGARGLAELRRQADDLLDRQARLQDAVRNLVESRALEGAQAAETLRDLQAAVSRLEATVGQMATAIANLAQRIERRD